MDQSPSARRSRDLPEGVETRLGKRGERLRITFTWLGQRRRETLDIPATKANIKYAGTLRAAVLNAIERGQFDYAQFFPNSKFARLNAPAIRARPTIGELIDTYISSARMSLSPSTLASYSRWANSRLKPKWGNRIAEEVTTPDIRIWIADLAAEMDNKSIRNCAGLFSAVLNRAAAESVIKANPMAPIKMKSVLPKKRKNSDECIDPFNEAEITAILAAFKTIEERAFWQFAFGTGLRTGELIAIKDVHADTVGNVITVSDNVVSADFGTVEKDTKTGKIREIPMLPAAKEAVLTIRSLNKNNTDYLFVTPNGQRWRDDQQLRKGSWIPALKRAGVRYRNPYQTRHTFASKLLMLGEPELLVAKLLGHSTVEMVRRHYGRFIKEEGGVVLRGDYSKFGADLGQQAQGNTTLIDVNAKTRTA